MSGNSSATREQACSSNKFSVCKKRMRSRQVDVTPNALVSRSRIASVHSRQPHTRSSGGALFALHVEGLHSCPQNDKGYRSATIWHASLSCALVGSCACTHITCASQLKKSSVSDFQTSSVQVSSQPQNDARGGVGGSLPSQVEGLHAPHSAGYSIPATRAQASYCVGYRCDSTVCK